MHLMSRNYHENRRMIGPPPGSCHRLSGTKDAEGRRLSNPSIYMAFRSVSLHLYPILNVNNGESYVSES